MQVWVRSDQNAGAFARGEVLAMEVQAVLHKANLSGYLSCLAQQAQPIHMQTDASGYYEFVLNFELWAIQ